MNEVNTGNANMGSENNANNSVAPSNSLKIQIEIPEELVSQILSGKFQNYLKLYFLLKAEAPGSGWIKNYQKQIPKLSKKFGMSENSFLDYLSQCEKNKIAFREADKIRIVGWYQLRKLFRINPKKRILIEFEIDD